MIKLLFVAERFNQRRSTHWERYLYDSQHYDVGRWCEISFRVGAFLKGDGRDRLESLGFEHLDLGNHGSMNLLPPATQDVAWDAKKALDVSQYLTYKWKRRADYDAIVLVGRRVADAFGYRKSPLGSYYLASAFILPHPSGLSRWWNDEVNLDVCRKEVEEWMFLLKHSKKGSE